jgi:hypothetical protein
LAALGDHPGLKPGAIVGLSLRDKEENILK